LVNNYHRKQAARIFLSLAVLVAVEKGEAHSKKRQQIAGAKPAEWMMMMMSHYLIFMLIPLRFSYQ